jgi:Leucine-rich repeat (LRR) protein
MLEATSAIDAHALVCDLVAAQADNEGESSSWADYGAVFLSAEVQDLIRARLGGDGPVVDGPRKKSKLAISSPVSSADVSWTICCMDGATFSVAVPEDAPVAELKRAIGVLREVPCFTMELFVKDVEAALDDAKPLRSLDRAPLFLLLKPASDRLALEALFQSTNGAGWREKGGWMTDADLGEWFGVTVDAEGRVIKVVLEYNGLAGPFPREIQQLSALEQLDLDRNRLTGVIPAELGQLAALRLFTVYENQLSGPIPAELGQLGALTVLALGTNQLTGPIPAELAQLAAMEELYLDRNQLSGTIPAALAQMGAPLVTLDLFGNQHLMGQEALRASMVYHNPDCDLEL